MDGVKRRACSKMRLISGIEDKDIRVSVVGTVIDIDRNNLLLVINDKTGNMNVILNSESQIEGLKVKDRIRVIGLVARFKNETEIRAEIVQNFNGINMEYYYKLLES